MRLSAVFPTCEIGVDPGAIRAWVRAVEELGFDAVVVFDHVLGAVHADRVPPLWGPYDETVPFHEPLTLLSHLAAITTRVELATGVLVLPQRQTALVAKQATQVDLLSGGRLRLGVGVGWNPVEYESLGVPFAARGARLDEQIALLRALWTGEVVDVDGRFHRIDRASILPRPGRPIPIWVGGFTAPALRRAALLSDGFIMSPTDIPRAEAIVGELRQELLAAGRNPQVFPIEIGCLWGSGPERVADVVATASRLGATHVSVNTMTGTSRWRGEDGGRALAGVDQHIDALLAFCELARAAD